VLRLQTLKMSRESSALHPVSGINYLPERDALIVTIFDGSFHVIRNLSSSPTLVQASSELVQPVADPHATNTNDGLSSQGLSLMSRRMFERAEKGNVNKSDMNRIHGAISYDSDAVFLWAYECVMLGLLGKIFAADLACQIRSSRPSDFSYKQDSRQNSTLVVAPLWDASDNATFLRRLSLLLGSTKTCMFCYLLWDLKSLKMFYMRSFGSFAILLAPTLLLPF